ncbi:hypothetical protein [Crateriforma conspicua]|uniref:hypothetical protein n=1 Tax=Crateriforma conspicua TaxID=2527996 RepID=UPI0011B68DB6|nr:hypothetical protein [Crateriforma conspicua]
MNVSKKNRRVRDDQRRERGKAGILAIPRHFHMRATRGCGNLWNGRIGTATDSISQCGGDPLTAAEVWWGSDKNGGKNQ